MSFDEFMAKLDTFEDELAKQDPISALHETVQVQRHENEALLKEIGKKRSELIPLLKSFKSNNIDLAV